MGAGIAQVCAQAGWQTSLYDAFPEGLERGMDRIAAFWEKGIARGKTTPEQRDSWSANLTAVNDLAAAVDEADLVIEAVPELPDLKHSIFAELDTHAPAHAILGTNTSSLSIADIAKATSRPEKVIGMHFFNPVPIMKLLELVRHEHTSEDTIAIAEQARQAMGKTTIVVEMSRLCNQSTWAWCWATRPFACSLMALPAPKTSTPPWCSVTNTRWVRWPCPTLWDLMFVATFC